MNDPKWQPGMTMYWFKKHALTQALRLLHGNRTQAAQAMGVSLRSVRIWINKYKIHVPYEEYRMRPKRKDTAA